MIEKILDNYFEKKLKEMIKRHLLFWINLETRFIENENYFTLQIKDEKYNEYCEIISFNKKESVIFISLWGEIKEKITKLVEEYYKEINL